jgi:dTDP-glucose 4,6-dehydratase
MDLTDKKILVTGAGGFIGSHLTEELAKKGCKVRAFVRYKSSGDIGNLEEIDPEILKKIEVVRGDLKNPDSVKRAIQGIDVVFHLGALISIPYSYVDPRDFVETNVTGTLNILKTCQEEKVKKIIITSTSEVYGTGIYTPIDEKHPLQAQSPYSASKMSADKIAESFYNSYNLPVSTIRPFNCYGPRQSKRAVIPTIIYQALTSEELKLGSLEPKRDFTYVKDTAQGFIKVAESDNSIGNTFNISSGKTITIRELVETIGKILGKNLIPKEDKEKIRPEKSEVRILLGDNKKAKEILGWEPKHSLEQGLKKTIEHVRKNIKNYQLERENI